MKQDVIIKREFKGFVTPGGGPRSEIMRFSKASQRRLKLAVRNTSHDFKYMVTLTFPGEFPTDGRKVKRDWIAMRHILTRLGVCSIMVLGFQERGAPHFHLLTNDVNLDKKAISSAWYRIVGSNDEKHLKAGTSVEYLRGMHAAESYVSK